MNENPQTNIASRSKRLLAALIDGLASMLVISPLLANPEFLEAIKHQSPMPANLDYRLPLFGFLVLISVHAWLLYSYGQTIGKRIVGLAIVTLDGQKPAFGHLILFRYLPRWLFGSLPTLGPLLSLVDILFIFNSRDNRCIHDLIAKTKVIDLSIKIEDDQPANSFLA